MKILRFPLAHITVVFVGGILFANSYNMAPSNLIGLMSMILCALLILYYVAKRQLMQRMYFAIAVYFTGFAIGAVALTSSNMAAENNYKRHFDQSSPHIIDVVIREKLKPTVNNNRYAGVIRHIDHRVYSGQIMVNVRKPVTDSGLAIGRRLVFKAVMYRHRKPSNPYQFDYGKYLENNLIYSQVYIDAAQITVRPEPEISIWYYAGHIRDKIVANLNNSGFPKTELAVLSALILGQQQDISKEVLQDYQYAGAVHILSVSGLHVGFILLFVNMILKLLPNSKRNSYIRVVIVLMCLWGFAVLAGLAPSVVRSVTMFSFVAIGMHIRRTTNIFHTLLVSVLLILLCKPNFIFDVGFQLSYLALFFILWLQPTFAALWQPKSIVTKYFWDILTVSFAAQIGALPLSIYYFHQFPGLFFVTNLIIIPFLSIIMAIGVIVMIIAAFSAVPHILIAVLSKSIWLLNGIIARVASCDDFVIQDISYSAPLLLVSYLTICSLVLYWKQPTFHKAAAALVSVVLLQTTYLHAKWAHDSAQELIVFDIRKETLIAERRGSNIDIYRNAPSRNTFADNILNTYKIASFNKRTVEKPFRNVLFYNAKKIMIIDSIGIYPLDRPDIIVMTQSPKINLDRLLNISRPQLIIADGSNYKTYISLWKQTCEKQKIPFHATGEKGFYKLK